MPQLRQPAWMGAAMLAYATAIEVVARAVLVPALVLMRRRREIRERLGSVAPPGKRGRRRLVVHAVSAGEVRACAPLFRRLLADEPDAEIVLCTGTRDGRSIAGELTAAFPQIVATLYLPWDRPRTMLRWLETLQADAFVVVETELWPGLFAACRRLGVPLILVSARLYPRDVRRYAAGRAFWNQVLSAPQVVLVQDAEEAAAFGRIGAPIDRVTVGGNLKFDAVAPSPAAPPLAERERVIVGASTHHPEERVLMDAVEQLRSAGTRCRLILAPRDVRRAAGIRARAARHGLAVDVLDRMGTLDAAYARAAAVFVGGTLARRGGHNIIEPASRGLPCVVGPHVSHIGRVVDGLDRCGGVVRLPADAGVAAISAAFADLLGDRRGHAVGAAALAFCVSQRGASAIAAAAVRAAWGVSFRDAPTTPAIAPRDASDPAWSAPAVAPRAGY